VDGGMTERPTAEFRDDVLVVRGAIDLATAAALRAAAAEVPTDLTPVVIDLGECSFLDSSGINELVRIAADGRSVQLRRTPEPIRRLLDLAGVDELLRTVDEHDGG
jgi:anti-anti-sigma factor